MNLNHSVADEILVKDDKNLQVSKKVNSSIASIQEITCKINLDSLFCIFSRFEQNVNSMPALKITPIICVQDQVIPLPTYPMYKYDNPDN